MKTNKLKYTDFEFLEKNTNSDPALIIEMINIYLEQTPEILSVLNKAYEDKDWPLVKVAAHKLKPSFRMMGMSDEDKQLAIDIETLAAAENEPEKLKQLLYKLESKCQLVFTELKEQLYNLGI